MSQQPHPDRVRLLPWFPHPVVIDLVLSAFMVLGVTIRSLIDDQADLSLDVLGLAGAVGVIWARRRYPIPVLAAALVGAAALSGWSGQPTVLLMASLVALYQVATLVPWRSALIAGAVTVATFTTLVVAFLEPGQLDGGLLASIAWPAFAASAGAAVRSSRESLFGAQERARRAEETQELEANRRVAEERLRIARDVHDLVAHHLAVVNVQSGVAAHVLRADPDAAGTAIETVRSSAATAIDELGELLGVLRDPGGADGSDEPLGGSGAPVEPTPDLAAIDDLIASFSASGLTIEHRVTGAPAAMAPSVQVAAYRVIQEALTNAHKHGDGSVLVAQRFDEAAMMIEVTNRLRSRSGAETGRDGGFGLIGMRERVDAAGGDLTIDSSNGRFRILAELPTLVAP